MKGSAEDIEQLLRVSAKPILFQVLRRVPDHNEAEDVAQKIAILIIEHISSLRSPYAFNSWLHQIIARVCLAHNQEIWRRNSRQNELDPEMPVADEDIAVMPVEATEESDDRTRLYQFIRRLPRAQQEPLVMYYLEGLSYKEIAQIQKVGIGTISRNLSDAKKSLKRMMQEAGNTSYAEYAEPDETSVQPTPPPAPTTPPRANSMGGKLTAVTFGSAITEALQYQAGALVGNAEAERFVAFCHDAVQANLVALGATASATGITALVGKISALFAATTNKVALVAASICVATAAVGGTVYVTTADTSTSPPAQTADSVIRTTQTHYVPEAEVLFDGKGDEVKGVNPSEARLVLGDESGRVIGWTLFDENGTLRSSGEGNVIQAEFSALAPGLYTVEWSVTNESGAVARVHRSFIVMETVVDDSATGEAVENGGAAEAAGAAEDGGGDAVEDAADDDSMFEGEPDEDEG
jgi:RNA polymerase sigma-70 factor (ECF subfamily)